MANNIVNKVVVIGSWNDLSRFSKEVIGQDEDGDLVFDFNKIIRMPESFKETPNDADSEGAWTIWYGTDFDLSRVLGYSWVKEAGLTTRAEIQKYLNKKDPHFKAMADLLESNLKKYGAMTAYDWHVRHWGTKWNAWNFRWVKKGGPKEWSPGSSEISFRFTTAWSPPEPVYQAMAEKFPSLEFLLVSWAPEFACTGHFLEGSGSFDCGDSTPELYELVYDEPMPPEMEG